MTRLILTFDDSAAGALIGAGLADRVIPFCWRFVWGELKPENELDLFLSPRSARPDVSHCRPFHRRLVQEAGNRDLGLVEFCERFETVELWVDPGPNAQLQMIWLLDHLRLRAKSLDFTLRHVDIRLGETEPGVLPNWNFPAGCHQRTIISKSQPSHGGLTGADATGVVRTPDQDLSILPSSEAALWNCSKAPGRTPAWVGRKSRILELISAGYWHPFDVFPHYRQRFQRRVFGYWEVGAILERLALAPAPAVSGLAEWPVTLEMHDDREPL